jgi:hypothetical protein
VNRDLARAARRLADQQTARIADLPRDSFYADVVTVAPLVILWRSGTYEATGHHASYTPSIGDRVECHLVSDQLCVRDKIVTT